MSITNQPYLTTKRSQRTDFSLMACKDQERFNPKKPKKPFICVTKKCKNDHAEAMKKYDQIMEDRDYNIKHCEFAKTPEGKLARKLEKIERYKAEKKRVKARKKVLDREKAERDKSIRELVEKQNEKKKEANKK